MPTENQPNPAIPDGQHVAVRFLTRTQASSLPPNPPNANPMPAPITSLPRAKAPATASCSPGSPQTPTVPELVTLHKPAACKPCTAECSALQKTACPGSTESASSNSGSAPNRPHRGTPDSCHANSESPMSTPKTGSYTPAAKARSPETTKRGWSKKRP